MLPLDKLDNIGILHVFKGFAEIPDGDSRFLMQNRNLSERGLNKKVENKRIQCDCFLEECLVMILQRVYEILKIKIGWRNKWVYLIPGLVRL